MGKSIRVYHSGPVDRMKGREYSRGLFSRLEKCDFTELWIS